MNVMALIWHDMYVEVAARHVVVVVVVVVVVLLLLILFVFNFIFFWSLICFQIWRINFVNNNGCKKNFLIISTNQNFGVSAQSLSIIICVKSCVLG